MNNAVDVARSAAAMGLSGVAKVLRTGADAANGLARVVLRARPGRAARSGLDRAEDAASTAARTAAETAETAADTAADLTGATAETAADATERAAETAADATEAAADTAADVTGRAAETAADATETAADTAADLTGRAADTAADATEAAAETAADAEDAVTPDDEPAGRSPADEVVEELAGRGSVQEPAPTGVPDVTHAASPSSHVAELARGTVAQVVRAIDGLSTDELRQLLEHEQANKRRKGVLDAVEQALTP